MPSLSIKCKKDASCHVKMSGLYSVSLKTPNTSFGMTHIQNLMIKLKINLRLKNHRNFKPHLICKQINPSSDHVRHLTVYYIIFNFKNKWTVKEIIN